MSINRLSRGKLGTFREIHQKQPLIFSLCYLKSQLLKNATGSANKTLDGGQKINTNMSFYVKVEWRVRQIGTLQYKGVHVDCETTSKALHFK